MKVVVVDTYYGAFLRSHYSAEPDLADAAYEEQHAALMARLFGTSDFYSRHLRALGHEAVEVVANCLPLQRRWARERGGRKKLPGYLPERVLVPALRRLLVQQIESLKPDIVYVQDLAWVGPAAVALRAHTGLLVGQHASTAPAEDVVSSYDLLVSSLPNLVERFRAGGADAEYLPLAFEPAIAERLPGTAAAADVVHVGGYGPIHGERNDLLERVAARVPIDFWGYAVDELDPASAIRRGYRGEAWGTEMYDVRAAARITLTKHIGAVAGTHANNATLFEATGVGSCLVVDERSDLGELFDVGTEVVTYTDADDCAAQIEALLTDEPRRSAIAAAGRARTQREHTWRHRIERLGNLLESRLGKPRG